MNATSIVIIIAVVSSFTLPAAGRDEASNDSSWAFTFTPGAWITRLQGDATLGPSALARQISLHTELGVNDHEAALGGELTMVLDDRWTFQLGGFDFSTDSAGVIPNAATFGTLLLAPGDAFTSSFEMTSVVAEFGWWMIEPICMGPMPDDRECRLSLQAGPVGGVRYIDVAHSITQIGVASESADGRWIVPYLGAEMLLRYDTPDSLSIFDSFEISGGCSVGPVLGGDGGSMIQLHAGMKLFFTPNFGAGLEYRLIELDAENDDYRLEGGLQGLFLSASLRF